MTLSKLFRALLCVGVVTLPSCGGGGGSGGVAAVTPAPPSSGGGIGGSGVTSSGTIDAFGSIFVNGVEYETGSADITLNGESVGEDALRLGMVVVVKGTVNDDGTTGNATTVVFDSEVKGPITDIQLIDGGTSKVLTILGVEVIVEQTGTVFDDVSFDTLGVDDLLEISGFRDANGRLRATRVEKKSGFTGGTAEVELKGMVEGLVDTQFTFGVYTVDFSGADLSEVSGGMVQDGMNVEVKGTLDGNVITATKIEEKGGLEKAFDDNEEVSVQGAITNFVDNSSFSVAGVEVDASNARMTPADLILAAGIVVEVEGQWDGTILLADKLESRRGRIEIEAMVSSVGADSITLQLFGGTVTVTVDNRTLLDDDTDQVYPLTLADIGVGDFLEVEAVQVGDTLLATRVDRDNMDDDVLQGPVDDYVDGSSVTILGISYQTAGAEFEAQGDMPITEAEFYSMLNMGMLIKVKDREIADGIADKIEFKSEIKYQDDFENDNSHDDGEDDHGSDMGDDHDSNGDSGNDSDHDSNGDMNDDSDHGSNDDSDHDSNDDSDHDSNDDSDHDSNDDSDHDSDSGNYDDSMGDPNEPMGPADPNDSMGPADPNDPMIPADPNAPMDPVGPTDPNAPLDPNQPLDPNNP